MPDDLKDIPALRDRKKARQRAELLQAAAELFSAKGYDKTRMEDIATLADVSTPTVYNYFSTKHGVLKELLAQDRRDMQEPVEAILHRPPEDPAEALAQLIHANMVALRRTEDKVLWREMLAAIVRAHDEEQEEYDRSRKVFKRQIQRLLQHYVDAGRLSRILPLAEATELVYAINTYNLRYMLAADRRTPEMIRDMARRQMALLLSGWATYGSTAPAGSVPTRTSKRNPLP